MESSSGEWFLAEPSIVAAIEECHVRQRGAVCPAICREDPFRIWRFNRKRKIARSPYCASESWTEWELALWTNVVPVCKKTGNVRINVTFRCTRITTDIVEKQSECVFVALGLSIQSACSVLHCHLWPACVYRILLYYLMKGTDFRKERRTQHVVMFPTTFSKAFLILRRIQWDIIMQVHMSSYEVSVNSCQILTF